MKCIGALLVILTMAAPAAGQTIPTFVTAESPIVSVGGGAGSYFLNRVGDATRTAAGTIMVGACGSVDLRIYDERGGHLRTVGMPGEASEYQAIRRLFPAAGDEIAVVELRFPDTRINFFTQDGTHVRSVTLPIRAEPVGRTADGQFVLVQPDGYRSPRPPLPPGVQRRTTALYKMTDSGTITDSIVGLPGYEVFVRSENSGPPEFTPRFPRGAVVAVHRDRIIFGAQDAPSFLEISSDFRSRVERRTVTEPQPVTPELQSEWVATRPVLTPRGGVIPVYADAYSPATPAYKDIIAGSDGRVWIQDPELPGAYPMVWTAYTDGSPTARVELPIRFFPFEFGADWVLGVSYDDESVERVQVFNLTRGALSGRKLSPREAAPPATPRCGSWTAR
jgi:hypothetical protein